MEEWVKKTYIFYLSDEIDFDFIWTVSLKLRLSEYQVATNG
jgi:hypothetical protein